MARDRFACGFRVYGEAARSGSDALVRFERVGLRDGYTVLTPTEACALAAVLLAGAGDAEGK